MRDPLTVLIGDVLAKSVTLPAESVHCNGEYHGKNQKPYRQHMAQPASTVKARILNGLRERRTIGWQQTCKCDSPPIEPCTVLDPFGGSGTVGQVALGIGRRAILIDLDPDNLSLIERRCSVNLALPIA